MTQIQASGAQYVLTQGESEAVVASVGASLRSFTQAGRPLVVGFDADEVRPNYRGTTLAPWPNRVVDGRYTFGGVARQLALTEPTRGHALHGLLAWAEFRLVALGRSHVVLEAVVEPQDGYPWRVRVVTTYTLDDDSLTQSVCAENLSDAPAPFGTGPHPYLVAGEGAVDDWTLELPASLVLAVTPDRLSPTELLPVGEAFDFRAPRQIGATEIDHAFTGLDADDTGLTTVRVTDPSGAGVAMTWDGRCPWVQIHTADTPGSPATHRVGLAVEPMTCAPDAFNAARYPFDTGLIVLPSGGTAEASWCIRTIPAP